jgi:hypothetical protein
MWLGCSSRGYREAYALLKMRQEALQAAGISAEEAARIHIVAEMKIMRAATSRQRLGGWK